MTECKPPGWVCCALIFGTCLAFAWDVAKRTSRRHRPAPRAGGRDGPHGIPRGLWTLDLFGSYEDRFTGIPREMAMGNAGFNCYFLDNISMGCEFNGMFAHRSRTQGRRRASAARCLGIGLAYSLRDTFFRVTAVDVWRHRLGAGRFQPADAAGRSHFNFTVGVGGGSRCG